MAPPSLTSSSPLPAPLPKPQSQGMQKFDIHGAKHLCDHLRRYNQRRSEPDTGYGLVQGASNTCGHDIAVPQETRDKIVEGDIATPIECMECLISSYRKAANKLAQRNTSRVRNPIGPSHKSLVEKVREKMMDIGNLQLLQDNRADWGDSRAMKMTAQRPQGAPVKKVAFADNDIVLSRCQSPLGEGTTEQDSTDGETTNASAQAHNLVASPSVEPSHAIDDHVNLPGERATQENESSEKEEHGDRL